MARLERPTTESRNPATKFLEWKSNDKCFSYYDKELKENISVELPLKFLFIEHYHTVKGWHDKSESGIYSNEVYSIGNTLLEVKAFKGGEIASGFYKDIKDKVKNAGGNYARSIYVMLEDGSMANIQLKGSAVGGIKKEKSIDGKDKKGWSEFYNDNQSNLDYHWIEINAAAEGKSGSVKYSIPEFEFGKRITDKTDKMASETASMLGDYMRGYLEDKPFRDGSVVDEYEKNAEELVDELDI